MKRLRHNKNLYNVHYQTYIGYNDVCKNILYMTTLGLYETLEIVTGGEYWIGYDEYYYEDRLHRRIGERGIESFQIKK